MSLALQQETPGGSWEAVEMREVSCLVPPSKCSLPAAASRGHVVSEAGQAQQPLLCNRESDLVVLVEEEEE